MMQPIPIASMKQHTDLPSSPSHLASQPYRFHITVDANGNSDQTDQT